MSLASIVVHYYEMEDTTTSVRVNPYNVEKTAPYGCPGCLLYARSCGEEPRVTREGWVALPTSVEVSSYSAGYRHFCDVGVSHPFDFRDKSDI